LVRATLLQILFTIHPERQLCERIDHDFIFRRFNGLGKGDPVWNHPTFSKNWDRLMTSSIGELLFDAIKKQDAAKQLFSRQQTVQEGKESKNQA
jgi:transposase